MKRYDIYVNFLGDKAEEESSAGDWVKYEDAQAAIQSERAEADKLFAALVEGAAGYKDDGSVPKRIQGLLDAIRARSTP